MHKAQSEQIKPGEIFSPGIKIIKRFLKRYKREIKIDIKDLETELNIRKESEKKSGEIGKEIKDIKTTCMISSEKPENRADCSKTVHIKLG